MIADALLHFLMVEVEGDDTGDHNHKGNHQFEETGQDETLLTFGEGCGSENTLGDVLVEPPIVKIRDPDSDDQNASRQRRRQNHNILHFSY